MSLPSMRARITGYTLREEPGSSRTFQLLGLGEGNIIGFGGPSEVLESSTFVAPCHDIVGIEPDASSKHLMASSSLAHFIMHPTIIN